MSKKLPKIISREDAAKILAVPNIKTTIGLRNRTILQVMYRAGLRVSEVCNLMIEDVNLKDGYLYIQCAKGQKDRIVPIDYDTIAWCQRWLDEWQKWSTQKGVTSEYFFPTLKGTQLDQRYLRDMFYRLSDKAKVYIRDGKKLKKLWPHILRHTCFTEMLEEGFTIREVQEMAGHSSLNTTMIYAHVRPEILAAKIRQRAGNGA